MTPLPISLAVLFLCTGNLFFLKSLTRALFVLIVALMFEKFMQIYVRISEIFWDEISMV